MGATDPGCIFMFVLLVHGRGRVQLIRSYLLPDIVAGDDRSCTKMGTAPWSITRARVLSIALAQCSSRHAATGELHEDRRVTHGSQGPICSHVHKAGPVHLCPRPGAQSQRQHGHGGKPSCSQSMSTCTSGPQPVTFITSEAPCLS